MNIKNTIDIAVGKTRRSRKWKMQKTTWPDLVDRLKNAIKTNHTFKEYSNASKAEKGEIKDVGGYVGAYLRGGRRKPNNVVHKQLVTLDIDRANEDFWDDFELAYDCAAFLHSTHSHGGENIRYRLVIPLDREVDCDEYAAISRKVAGNLDIEIFDPTTFQPERLMYWPATAKDVDYYYEEQKGDWLSADDTLAEYIDWKDASLWPTSSLVGEKLKGDLKKQADPTEKKGLIGAFCRTYTMSEAIDELLSDEYRHETEDRYTYLKGSTSNGVVVYDDMFLYSHHGTDPCSTSLVNAFDAVRLHKFGHLDEDRSSGANLPSFAAMQDFVLSDKKVKKTLAKEAIDSAIYDFEDDDVDEFDDTVEEVDETWMEELEADRRGKYLSTSGNIDLIFKNDPRLKDKFKYNIFSAKKYICKSLPWRKVKQDEPMRDVDLSGLRNYFENIYGIVSNKKIEDSLDLVLEKKSFHPIRDYLNGLKWDGTRRVDTLMVEYLGAVDNVYTREVCRKFLVGAVARVMVPGIKFELVPILVGNQGIGKSTFYNVLGGEWFSDTFMSVHGKDALEQIQGSWIIEMSELAGLRKSDVDPVKGFLSKKIDDFRPAYGHFKETYRRQCVFGGSTNVYEFLKDLTGNRRFDPIDCNMSKATKSMWDDMEDERDQIWAEALQIFKKGEDLFLSPAAEAIAQVERQEHCQLDERSGALKKYLDARLPVNWENKSIIERVEFFRDDLEARGKMERRYICIAEIWCEFLREDLSKMNRYNTKEVHDLLSQIDGWKKMKSTKNFGPYGKQKYYAKSD